MTAAEPPSDADICAVADALLAGDEVAADRVRAAVLATLASLAALAPGRSVEIRVPPHAAVQAVPGAVHRRGTPRARVECDARTWLALACGRLTWSAAGALPGLHASGERSDLSPYLPLVTGKAGQSTP